MSSLLEQLPKIVADGKREAERIMERLESSYRIGLQTRELVIPSRDSNWQDMFAKAEKANQDLNPATMNRLIYGDNLLAMAALLAGNEQMPPMRGKVDLIYIDPPFDSKADYRTKINIPGGDVEQKPAVIEQFAYSDTWKDGRASYLAMLVPRLALLKELLSDNGSIYVHIGWQVAAHVRVVLDELFGLGDSSGGGFRNEISWRCTTAHSDSKRYGINHQTILFYTKTARALWNDPKGPYDAEYIEKYFRYFEGERRFKSGDLSAYGLSGGGYEYEWNGHVKLWRCPPSTMQRNFSMTQKAILNKLFGRTAFGGTRKRNLSFRGAMKGWTTTPKSLKVSWRESSRLPRTKDQSWQISSRVLALPRLLRNASAGDG